MIQIDDLRAAADRIRGDCQRTPLLSSRSLSERAGGGAVFLKAENLQTVGAFKLRGALNAVRSLTEGERARGVTTYSSGNHGQALAKAAQLSGCDAVVFVPENANPHKVAAARSYGADVRFAGTTSVDRQEACEALVAERGLTLVRPFDDDRIIAGQGTVGLELVDQAPDPIDVVLVPTGGGGLLAGVAIAVTDRYPAAEVYAVEPTTANAMQRALSAGEPVTIPPSDTIADGLKPLRVGERNCAIALERVRGAITVEDDEIEAAMRFCLLRARQVVEPSGAVGVAALLSGRLPLAGRTAVVVLSGGNADPALLARVLQASSAPS